MNMAKPIYSCISIAHQVRCSKYVAFSSHIFQCRSYLYVTTLLNRVVLSWQYLNSGAGGIGAIYIHEKHATTVKPDLRGWWGYSVANRFAKDTSETVTPVAGSKFLTHHFLASSPVMWFSSKQIL